MDESKKKASQKTRKRGNYMASLNHMNMASRSTSQQKNSDTTA